MLKEDELGRGGHLKVRGDQAVEEPTDIATVGAAIRALRRERGLSLKELAERTGFSISFLSLAERGRSSLALTSLYKVAKALDTDVARFFSVSPDAHPLPHLAKASETSDVAIAGSRRTYKLLSSRAPGLVLEPLLVTVEPTAEIEEPYSHEGEEFAYVLSGELLVVIAGVQYRLGAGDSIHFQSSVPHAIHNGTDEPVAVVWVLTPRLI